MCFIFKYWLHLSPRCLYICLHVHTLAHKLKLHFLCVEWMFITWWRLVHHVFSGRDVNNAWHPPAPPPCCSASYFVLRHYFQESPLLSPFPSVTRSPLPSSPSIHLSSEPLSRARGCCMRGILGLWRQFGNEARLHLNTLLSGHMVNLIRGGWGEWRGEVGDRGEMKREGERAKGVIATLREEREELKREGSKGGSVWRTLANINSLCKSAAQTNWQAGITPERSWIKSMKALAPLTLDLQPRPVHRSVPVMHTNDSGGAIRTVTSQHFFFFFFSQRYLEMERSTSVQEQNYAERKTPEMSVFSLKQTRPADTDYSVIQCLRRIFEFFTQEDKQHYQHTSKLLYEGLRGY